MLARGARGYQRRAKRTDDRGAGDQGAGAWRLNAGRLGFPAKTARKNATGGGLWKQAGLMLGKQGAQPRENRRQKPGQRIGGMARVRRGYMCFHAVVL